MEMDNKIIDESIQGQVLKFETKNQVNIYLPKVTRSLCDGLLGLGKIDKDLNDYLK